VPVILNATAGGGRAHEPDAIRERFASLGMPVEMLVARDGAHLLDIAEEQARKNPPLLVAGGGDGTMSTVASVLAGSDTALGVLPLGTFNHFAKDLGVPLDLGDAVRTVVTGSARSVDIGDVNGRTFLNNSSLGLYPDIVHERVKLQRRLGHGKFRAMFWATLTALRRTPFLAATLRVDGERKSLRAPFVFIGNNVYLMEGFDIGSRERLDAGVLSVYLTTRRDRWALVILGLRALFGRLRQAKDFAALTAHGVRIETRHRRLLVATDGEVALMNTPLDYSIRPGALRVILGDTHANAGPPV
jgi:diacylglycerol kinase family enzyme